ncbi:MAG: T9SS type A sorting domain-containing protein, partial [Phaeodactylibacter sp.]|nr:T9SS type A sorting domain-containing protein [Phaeodactylibacter sp.]
WLEDAAGQKDTITIGYDAGASYGIDPQFGEADIKALPFPDSMEARAASYLYGLDIFCFELSQADPTSFHSKVLILDDECMSTPEDEPGVFLIANAHFPVTVRWDQGLFENACRNRSFLTDWVPGGWFDVGCTNNDIIMLDEQSEVQLVPAAGSYMPNATDTAFLYFVAFRGDSTIVGTPRPGGRTEISLFPNPASGEVFILPPTGEPLEYLLFDAMGRRISAGGIQGRQAVPLPAGLPEGLYYFRFFGRDGSPQGGLPLRVER